MTPERLSEIQGRYANWPADKLPTMHDGLTAISDAVSLVAHIGRTEPDARHIKAPTWDEGVMLGNRPSKEDNPYL